MGKSQKSEASYQLTREGTVDYLRRLADRLEGEEFDLEETVLELEDLVKVKETIKEKGDKFSIKIKLKLAGFDPSREDLAYLGEAPGEEASPLEPEDAGEPDEEPAPENAETETAKPAGPEPESEAGPKTSKRRPSFKSLKKKMNQNLKEIKTALREEMLPEQALLEEFLAQCRLMVTYTTKGQPYFEEFERATDALAKAWKGEDRAAMDEALAEMGRLKRNCHRRFK